MLEDRKVEDDSLPNDLTYIGWEEEPRCDKVMPHLRDVQEFFRLEVHNLTLTIHFPLLLVIGQVFDDLLVIGSSFSFSNASLSTFGRLYKLFIVSLSKGTHLPLTHTLFRA